MEQLLICLSAALIAGLLMSRLAKAVHLPAVTSYLLAGLLLGPFFLGRLGLSNFGIAFRSLGKISGAFVSGRATHCSHNIQKYLGINPAAAGWRGAGHGSRGR